MRKMKIINSTKPPDKIDRKKPLGIVSSDKNSIYSIYFELQHPKIQQVAFTKTNVYHKHNIKSQLVLQLEFYSRCVFTYSYLLY